MILVILFYIILVKALFHGIANTDEYRRDR
jgi:hypothetical protein